MQPALISAAVSIGILDDFPAAVVADIRKEMNGTPLFHAQNLHVGQIGRDSFAGP